MGDGCQADDSYESFTPALMMGLRPGDVILVDEDAYLVVDDDPRSLKSAAWYSLIHLDSGDAYGMPSRSNFVVEATVVRGRGGP